MGPEMENRYTVYLDGVPIDREKIVNVSLTMEAQEPDSVLASQSLEFTVHYKTPKRWRCRGRKRFIKLMMSEGIDRNGAVWLADFVRKMMPYGEAWRKYFLHNIWIIRVG